MSGSRPLNRYASIDRGDDMAQRLRDALRSAEESAFQMKRGMDAGNVEEAVAGAQQVLAGLRLGSLSPKPYYELWMKVFDHLRGLHSFFLEASGKGTPMTDLYERVQSTTHIIPRLYLMITVGSAFIASEEALTQNLLSDFIEMSKGVQHPMRGLFLRNYLLKMTQDHLAGSDTSADFCVAYILQNFGEMNRLWVRMQHQGSTKNKTRREKERQDLKVLISFNLVRLSELPAMDLALYKASALDQILDIVTNCKDKIAQQYLLDVIVQVFPASFHLDTLDKLFDSFQHLEPTVDLKSILVGLMERIKHVDDDDDDDDDDEDDDEEEVDEEDEKDADDIDAADNADDADNADNADNDAVAAESEEESEGDADADPDDEDAAQEKKQKKQEQKEAKQKKEKEQKEQTEKERKEKEQKETENGSALSPRAFEQLNACVGKLIEHRRATLSTADVLDLQVALLEFAVACYPGRLDYIDAVLGFCAAQLDAVPEPSPSASESASASASESAAEQPSGPSSSNVDPKVEALVVRLLKVPLKQKELGSIELLGLSHFPQLMGSLAWPSKKKVAHGFLLHVLADPTLRISSAADAAALLAFVAPLIKDGNGDGGGGGGGGGEGGEEGEASAGGEQERRSFEQQQAAVARLMHRLHSDDDAELMAILGAARKLLVKGGPRRIRHTLVPLAFRYIALADMLIARQAREAKAKAPDAAADTAADAAADAAAVTVAVTASSASSTSSAASLRKVFQYLHELATALAGVVALEGAALRLFLQAAQVADRAGGSSSSSSSAGLLEVAYEFLSQAFSLYEEEADSKEQLRALPMLVGTLLQCRHLDEESFATFSTKTVTYAGRLLKRADQCRMLVACAHLFWAGEALASAPGQAHRRDAARVVECLQKSLKVADACMTPSLHVSLFVHILNRYVYFFDAGVDGIAPAQLADLVRLVRTNFDDLADEDRPASQAFLDNTMEHVRLMKEKDPVRYGPL